MPKVVQAVLFNKNYWRTEHCRKWLREHNFDPIKPVHITDKYFRYRINEPNSNSDYKMISLPRHIKLIVM